MVLMMKKYKIFVSGVQKELKKERRTVKELVSGNVLLNEHFDVFLFEDMPAQSKSAKKLYLDKVGNSSIYIGILGDHYGNAVTDNISATEAEFREAQKKNKEIYVYIKGRNDSKRDKRVQKLIAEIKNPETGYSYKRFYSIDELKNNIYESLIDFLREKGIVGKTAFDRAVCEDASFNDIDKEKVKWFLRMAKDKRNYPLSEQAPVKDVLTHLNLLHKGTLTNAAILLFGKNPQKFHLQAEIKCLQFHGTEVKKPFASYHIYKGNLFEQIDRAVAFVLGSIRMPVIQQADTAQAKRPLEIPVFAVQEAIVNAAAHRDYNPSAAVQVMVFIDRVEVWNPGRLPSQLSIDDLKKPHTSYPGNPLLAEVLYLSDYIQKAGSGTIEMIEQCKQQGLPEPSFVSVRGVEFRTIIGRDILTEDMLIKLGLNERQMKAVKYVKERRKITNKEYRMICDTSERTATRDLRQLVIMKVFKQVGVTGKGTAYILKTP